jgi:hypothetical protein
MATVYNDPAARFAEHTRPLTKTRPASPEPDEREVLLAKAAACGNQQLLKGYQERIRALPESGPNLPADASAATDAMISTLTARGQAAPNQYVALGYFSRARTLQQWLDHGR